ncbi:hypothetical protein [Paracoccus sp. (in: a-proteobacteria)]|uniref:hypothetical protein n=1 Tax=Paracoccus sp. TaxID=267 RepID=UPI003A8436B5
MSWLRLEHLQAAGDGELVRDENGTPIEFRVPCRSKGGPILPERVCCTAPLRLKNGTKTIRYRDRRIEPGDHATLARYGPSLTQTK